jgi:hypothetical protein
LSDINWELRMDNDLIFGTETSDIDMLAGNAAGGVQIAAAPTGAEPYPDALTLPLDAAKVEIPQGENVVRVPVTPGEVVELPFPADSQFLAREDNGNLAIKVGDITVILQGYVEAAGSPTPPVIEASNGQPIDIATILASTDPNIDIQTAAGPAAGPQGQGADNTGGILQLFGAGAGLGGFNGAGALDATEGPGNGPVDQDGTIILPFGVAAAGGAPGNNPPIANDDNYLTLSNTKLSVPAAGFLANDSDPDGDPVVASGVPQFPTHGVLAAFADGSFTYTPNANYFGADSFKVQITDGNGGFAVETVNIYVDAPPELASGTVDRPRTEDQANTSQDLNWVFVDKDDATQPTIAVDPNTLPPGVTYDAVNQKLILDTLGKYDYLSPGESENFTIVFNVTDAHGGVVQQTFTLTMIGKNDAGAHAVDDAVLTNVGVNATVLLPEWAVLANDKDSSSEDVSPFSVGGTGFNQITHTFGVGQDGSIAFKDDGTLGGTVTYNDNDASGATVTITNQQGGDLTGTTAHEIIVSGAAGDKIDGKGGKDVIFGGDGDDTVIFHNGDIVQGQGDTIANSQALATAPTRGDVLVVDHDVNFLPLNLTHSDGIETISTKASDGGAGAQTLTIGAATVTTISDHTILPGGVFAEHEAVRIDGDAVDQLYLSISKDPVAGSGWADTGIDVNGYSVYAHETTAGSGATADAYVMVSNAIPAANVHLNADH